MAEVQLLGYWASPFSKRVEIALKLKGIQYEYIEEDIPINKSPRVVKYNPIYKKIPVFLHDGKSIAESLLILEYIDETWKEGTPLLPNDPYQRAMARFWAKFMDEKCLPEMLKLCYESNYEVRMKAKGELHELLKLLENELIKDNTNLFGEYIEIVSILITSWIGIIQEAVQVDILKKEEFPNICGWADKLMSRSFIKESRLPPRDKLLVFYKTYAKPLIKEVPQ
ncbi:putative glutathione S-transferase [Capsicum annuum]|uniref:glutathione transferase n=1 Tax=Capsicum annuum TaxID=4072 RepID=A0A2G2YRF8_CAPAN|nr:glutathione S-transferase U8 [Capsicum annuum]KAF3642812.1 putative glutathione S-transferase [Capsicum annuum]KAF3653046.1 putative glutathione S-transferase [Capsicum annuum]PHT72284.1 putative glutathione S-transferase [Capsicum annuum]